MSDFSIHFNNPWLLFLLIPIVAVVLYSFFRVTKKFRYTRGRVISLSLGLIIAVSCSLMAAGISFVYAQANEANEVILLVDTSFSNREEKENIDRFVKAAIEENEGRAKLGIVTFGYDQVYAVPLTEDYDSIYDTYIASEMPDESATDLAGALSYTQQLFEYPESGKVVVLTDGIETDGDAESAISALAMSGIQVDFVDFSRQNTASEVQLVQLNLPDQTIVTGKSIQLELVLESSIKTDVLIAFYDNGEQMESGYKQISAGTNSLYFTHSFETKGLHELYFTVKSADDTLEQNNILYSYVYIDTVDDILILQRENEAEELQSLLSESFEAELRNISDAPKTLDELRQYDQVILVNIANADMPDGFDGILNSYVYDYGGGLFTVGGTRTENGKEVTNVYNREDMQGSLFQEMLPVLAEDYTPPVAVMIVLDVSASMGSDGPNGISMMEEAKKGAKEGLKALDDRDYVGIVTFGSTAKTVLPLTPVSERRKIESAIDRIDVEMSGTVYSNGLERAGMALKAIEKVNKKHIIFISDGSPSGGDTEYLNKTEINKNAGITTSCISYYTKVDALENIALVGGGKTYLASDGSGLSQAIKEDLAQPEIRDFEYGTFQPEIGELSSIFDGILEKDIPTLEGFFGTKLKSGAHAYLIGEYGQPIYAQWNYGNGKVGSFMCDLNGKWSEQFLSQETGRRLVANIAGGLFPQESVGIDDIELTVEQQNYSTGVNIYTLFDESDRIDVAVYKVTSDGGREKMLAFNIENFNGNQKVWFSLTESGVYEIVVTKTDAQGKVLSENSVYQEFSYSEEYDPFLADGGGRDILSALAAAGEGRLLASAEGIYGDLITEFTRTFDPRIILASIVIISLLLDVAVRKFKFKWPHEIIRERRAKKSNQA